MSSRISKQALKANTWPPKLWCTQKPAACHRTRNQIAKRKAREFLNGRTFFTAFLVHQLLRGPRRTNRTSSQDGIWKVPILSVKTVCYVDAGTPVPTNPERDQGLGTSCCWQHGQASRAAGLPCWDLPYCLQGPPSGWMREDALLQATQPTGFGRHLETQANAKWP